MAKSSPPFLQKGGGTKIAKGIEPRGAKSKKLPKMKFGSSLAVKQPGVKAAKAK